MTETIKDHNIFFARASDVLMLMVIKLVPFNLAITSHHSNIRVAASLYQYIHGLENVELFTLVI